jgi:hypothetical protein
MVLAAQAWAEVMLAQVSWQTLLAADHMQVASLSQVGCDV